MNITSQYKGNVHAQFQVKPSTLTPSYLMYCVSDRIRNRALVSHCFHRQHHMNHINLLQYLSWENTYCTVLGWECLAYKGIVSQGSLIITAVASILMSYSNTRKRRIIDVYPITFYYHLRHFRSAVGWIQHIIYFTVDWLRLHFLKKCFKKSGFLTLTMLLIK